MNVKNIELLLREMEHLLIDFSQKEWANTLQRSREAIADDELSGRSAVLTLFGGLGGLNHLVLYREGSPSIAETNRLHDLKEKLYLELHKRD